MTWGDLTVVYPRSTVNLRVLCPTAIQVIIYLMFGTSVYTKLILSYSNTLSESFLELLATI
jgi:hypothetical protein